MDVPNIKVLSALLDKLGFSNSLDTQIVYHACLRQKEFTIKEQKVFDEDVMTYHMVFKESVTSGKLVCAYHDASLRKNIEVLPLIVNKVDLLKLDERMKGVNWKLVSQSKMLTEFTLSDKDTWKEYKIIEEIILDLEALASEDKGIVLSDSLKFKYWIDSSLEGMIPNLNLLKSRFEFSQRFYIIGNDGITAGEAYRFLYNRWMQKQLQITRKHEPEDKNENKEGKGAKGTTKNKKSGTKTKGSIGK